MRQVVHTTRCAVARAAAKQQGQVARRGSFKKTLFQRQDQFNRHAVTAKTGAAQGIAVAQNGNGLGCGNDFLSHDFTSWE